MKSNVHMLDEKLIPVATLVRKMSGYAGNLLKK